MTPSTPAERPWLQGLLKMLEGAVEGGAPGQPTGFLDNTPADGSGNSGLIATLARLSAAQAGDPTVLGLSVAAHAAHMAFHLEVAVRWARGERGPFDWKGSFGGGRVTDGEWMALKARVQAACGVLMALARQPTDAPQQDTAEALTGAAAHVAYHLGAVRQVSKLL